MTSRFHRATRHWIAVAVIAGGFFESAVSLRADSPLVPTLPTPTEAWRAITGERLLCTAGDQLWFQEPGEVVRVLGVERLSPDAWTLRDNGHLKTYKVSRQAQTLRMELSGQVSQYKRLDSVPSECFFKAVPVGEAHPVPRERVLAVSQEMYDRMVRDQAAIRAGNGHAGPGNPIIIENRDYLKALIQELGWIDPHRFGDEAAGNALVIAKHSQDISLMAAILPFVKKEFSSPRAENVVGAILYDGLLIKLGKKQHYGTQLGVDTEGHPMVLPLEDLSKVEQFRKEIGLPPLAEYLKLASEGLYSGKPIRMPRADE